MLSDKLFCCKINRVYLYLMYDFQNVVQEN